MSEIHKFFYLVWHFFRHVFLAAFLNRKQSKQILSDLYLTILYDQSVIPTVAVMPKADFDFRISSHFMRDLPQPAGKRFVLMNHKELTALLTLLKNSNPKQIFEFGLMFGGSLYHYLLNTDSSVQIHCADLSDSNLRPEVRQLMNQDQRVNFFLGDSRNLDTSSLKDKVDFILVDGGHDYEIVKSDTTKAFEMISQNGIIVWDDYHQHYPGVFQYLNELFRKEPRLRHIEGTSLVFLDNGSL